MPPRSTSAPIKINQNYNLRTIAKARKVNIKVPLYFEQHSVIGKINTLGDGMMCITIAFVPSDMVGDDIMRFVEKQPRNKYILSIVFRPNTTAHSN